MIKLRVKIESNGNTFNYRFEKPDDFIIAKENLELQELVNQACEDSHFEDGIEITLYSQMDW